MKNETGSFITRIDEVIGEDSFTVLAPLEGEQRLIMKPGETFLVSCVTDRGLYMFEVLIKAADYSQAVATMELKAISDYKNSAAGSVSGPERGLDVSASKRP
jgi:hypothetical protein